jgi:hypothetical protein
MGTNWTNLHAGNSGRLVKPDASRANIEFFNINTKTSIAFKGFLTSFTDTYNVNFNEEVAYGRMDPFRIYQNTVRSLSLAWDIPAWDEAEARANLYSASQLIKMLYPAYQTKGGTNAIIGSPIVRLRFANLIQQGDGGGDVTTSGLAGYIPSLTVTPDVEVGYYEFRGLQVRANPTRTIGPNLLQLYPKLLKMNCSFNVIHENSLGWKSKEWRSGEKYPYTIHGDVAAGFTAEGAARLGHAEALNPESNQHVALPGQLVAEGTLIDESAGSSDVENAALEKLLEGSR